MKDWQTEIEKRANAVYLDKENLLALAERFNAETIKRTKELFKDMSKTIEICCEEGRYDVAIDMLIDMRDHLMADQRKDMRRGYGLNATDNDRIIADEGVRFVGIYLDLVNWLIEDVQREQKEMEEEA